ncbi:MAG: MASE4 domain-containing protein [Proteobacteria bacterium]|nr:MASE4 domain-containing protein [Pseudomonadota bacterium]
MSDSSLGIFTSRPATPTRGDNQAPRPHVAERTAFLSTALAGRRDYRLAAGAVVVSIVAFAAAAPFAKTPLTPVAAFIPSYETALVVCDFVTAVMLLGQFAILRSRALLVLAGGYLFTAIMTVAHALTFPGLFAPTGLLGAGTQSTAWIYMFWHGGFPIAVICYALFNRKDGGEDRIRAQLPIALPCAVLAVLIVASILTLLATAGERALPTIMAGSRMAPAQAGVISAVCTLVVAAFAVLWTRRPRRVLDLWLMVVMCAWLLDVALSGVLAAGRFDLGFYAGRIYGLMAAGFVLAVMLVETIRHYSRLATAATQVTEYAGTLETRVRERTVELEQSSAMNQRIIETSQDLILVVDRTGTFIRVSPSVAAILGYRPEEWIGRNGADFVHPDDLERTRAEMRVARRGRRMRNFETRYVHKNGRAVTMAWTGVWSEPDQRHFFTGRDMTERIAAEEQLRQSQKMEAIGQLTGGLAHDFNNLLLVIMGNLGLLREIRSEDQDADELVREALDAARRGAELTRSLLAFARRQPLQPKRADMNELVTEITALLRRTLGERIEIALDLSPDAWPVVVDPIQLEAALANLATNARDAMPKGGRLSVVTANRQLDADYASQHADVTPGDYAMVQVSDTGTGMPPDVLTRVFEPFFTTKGRGEGTGLGLAMVFGFMKQSGGHVNVYSEVGVGTTFRLYLPRARAPAEAGDDRAPEPAPRGRGERVLVVEDNATLRRLATRQLTALGYRVSEAANAAAALECLKASQPFDLLFSDVVMAGKVDGFDLAQIVADRWPATRILLTSGFPDTRTAGADGAETNFHLLAKPYIKEDLARLVSDALNGGAHVR